MTAFIYLFLKNPSMKSFSELIANIEELEYSDTLLQEYKSNFDTLIQTEEPEVIEKALKEHPKHFMCIAPLLVGSWSLLHRFGDIYNLLNEIDLSGECRRLDYFNGKLIKYYYLCLKFLEKPMDRLYAILNTNREYGNEYSVAVATNAVLDIQINNHVYMIIHEKIQDPQERCKYCFYLGVIYLIQGEYDTALRYLDESDISNESPKLDLYIKKYTIVCKLLLSDYTIFYPYDGRLRPYFSLIGCMKRGDIEKFYRLIEENKEEYFRMNLYFVIRRLMENLGQEGLRKIAMCYSRIKIEDINRILGVNVNYLIHKTIKEGSVRGWVENGIFYSQNEGFSKMQFGEQIRRVVGVRKGIEKKMKYPAIVPLSYEKVFEGEIKQQGL